MTPKAKETSVFIAAIVSAFGLSGCSSPGHIGREFITREQADSIRNVGLIPPTNPDEFTIWDPGSATAWKTIGYFSPIGALAGFTLTTSMPVARRSSEFKKNSAGLPYDPAGLLEAKLLTGFADSGRALIPHDTPSATHLDAYLSVKIVECGYVRLPASDKKTYYPRVLVDVELVSADHKTAYFGERFNSLFCDERQVIGGARPEHCFDTVEALQADIATAIEGIDFAVGEVAERISHLLSPPSTSLYVFSVNRSYGTPDGSSLPNVLVDEKPIWGSQCVQWPLSPGHHSIRVYRAKGGWFPKLDVLEAKVDLDAEEGCDYYLKTSVELSNIATPHYTVKAVLLPESEGKKAVAQYKPIKYVVSMGKVVKEW
jgi:hypothetical protein